MRKKCDLSIVIPVYRSARFLTELHGRLKKCLSSTVNTYEIIFVEDCGGDNSWDLIKEIAYCDQAVIAIQLSRNYGQHNALVAGIRIASGDLIITMDDDLQHPPEELPQLILKINDGYDVVYGVPRQKKHSFFRNLASQITKIALQHAMGASTARQVSALRIFRSHLRTAFTDYKSPSVNVDVLLTWGTTKFGVCPLHHDERRGGESGYTTRKLVSHAMNMMTGFSTLPLKITTLIGVFLALFGSIILIYLISYLPQTAVIPPKYAVL